MTNICQLKRGFFVMRDCTNPSVKQCGNCRRFVCEHHSANEPYSNICVECAVSHSSNYSDDYWIYSYRNQYYQTGYEPFRYTDADYASFETFDDETEDWDDDYAGDFNDS